MPDRFRTVGEAIRRLASGAFAETASIASLIEAIHDAEITDVRPRPQAVPWKIRVIRPDDMLVLDFRGPGLVRRFDRLERAEPGAPAWLIAEHQSQSLADEAILQTADQATEAGAKDLRGHEDAGPPPAIDTGVPDTPVRIRAAGRSRLAFKMPDAIDQIDLTLEALLTACRTWDLALDGAAVADPVFNLGDIGGSLFETVASEFRAVTLSARSLLEGTLDDDQFAGLDIAAERIAEQSVAAIAAGRELAPRSTETLALREMEALLANSAPGGNPADVRSAAELYLRTASTAAAVTGLQRQGLEIGSMLDLSEGFFGVILKPRPPGKDRTAIEMPWRLIASPLPGAGFDHATTPVVRGGRTELWHTRLGPKIKPVAFGEVGVIGPAGPVADPRAGRQLRYIWSPDYAETVDELIPFSLSGLDRKMIVKLTAGYDEKLPSGGRFTPRPVDSKRLIMTALGGTLDADRRWKTRPINVDLLAWTHRMSQGRDSYVRVEYAGFLFPFGHAATLVKLSERKFQWRGNGRDRVAILRQRFFIVVREKIRVYPNGAPQPDLGRTMPFDAIEVMLDTTPDLDAPGATLTTSLPESFYSVDRPKRMAFWPARKNNPLALFNFPLVGTDAAGRRIPFSMPAMFVSEVVNQSAFIPAIRDHYNQSQRRTAPTQGATMRFADAQGSDAADVDLPAQSLLFRSHDPDGAIATVQATTLQQQPVIESALVKLASVERLTGQALTPEVVFDPAYIANGFGGANKSELFLKLSTPPALDFGSSGAGSDTVGGVAAPSMMPSALSRRHGVMSGDSAVNDGQFHPKDFFDGAKLLGFFKLGDILKTVDLGTESPKFTSVELPADGGLGERIETTFRLFQTLNESPVDALKLNQGGQSSLDLTATSTLFRDGSPALTRIEGTMVHFKLNLVGVIIIHFDRLRFLKTSGRKPDVDVDLNPQTGVTFGGPLEFINKLKDYIPSNAFSDPPDLQVTPAGITAGYSLGLPAIQCGILSLSNITLGAAFTLPFNGDAPTARFNFAERHNTFNLTVSLIGGGGFLAVVVGTDGVREIEAALEFGAQIAINLGVASGSVYIKGGFYFHYSISPEGVEFEGYIELGGRLSVLGLITVSLTFHLSLTYESKALPDKADGRPHRQNRLFGQAKLTVEIEILFFSASVSVKVEKTFAGSESDPLFRDFITDQSVWNEYCDAFA
ncbi:MAG: hypothetical protein ACOYLS_03655 [Polymorphobacter sp.]